MSWTHKQWRREVEKSLEREGITGFKWEMTGSNHQRVSGFVPLPSGKQVAFTMTVSLSPSCHRAPQHVRRDAKKMLRAAMALA